MNPNQSTRKTKTVRFLCVLAFTLHLFVFRMNFACSCSTNAATPGYQSREQNFHESYFNAHNAKVKHETHTRKPHSVSCDFCENAGNRNARIWRKWRGTRGTFGVCVLPQSGSQSQCDTHSTSMKREVRPNGEKIYCWFISLLCYIGGWIKIINRTSAQIEISKLR